MTKKTKKPKHTVGPASKPNRNIVERGKIDTPNTHIILADFPGLVHFIVFYL